MSDTRVTAADRGEGFSFHFDDVEVRSYPGESVAGALMAAGISVLRHTGKGERPRGQFCGMGVCFDCLVEVDGAPDVRACMTLAEPGLRVLSGRPPGKKGPHDVGG